MIVTIIKTLADLPSFAMERERDYFEYLISQGAEISLLSEGESYSALLRDGDESVFISPRLSDEDEVFVSSLYDFASKNELPLRIIDVAADEIPSLIGGIRDARITGDGEFFTLEVKNELSYLTDVPEVLEGDVYLSEPVFKFSDEYKRLATDRVNNRFWGNDLRVGLSDAAAEYFTEEAIAEFEKGISLTAYALVSEGGGENRFVGEGVLFRFDYKGGCEVGVRVLPEFAGRGYGSSILLGMIRIAEEIGVCRIRAEVFNDNVSAKRLFGKHMDFSREAEGILYYEKEL